MQQHAAGLPSQEEIEREGWDTPAAEYWRERAKRAAGRADRLRSCLLEVEAFIRREHAYGGSEAMFRGAAFPPDVEKLRIWDVLAATDEP